MGRTYLQIVITFLLTLLLSCNTVKVYQEHDINSSIDIVFLNNIFIKTPEFDKKDLTYDTFYKTMVELKSHKINFHDLCNITSNDIELWKRTNEAAKKNIPLLNFSGKDFKIINVEASEKEYSKVYALPSDDKNIFCPFIHLEVEYTDKSIGTINVVFYNNKIFYIDYSEVLPEIKNNRKNHHLLVRINYFPNGHVKSYYSKSSFLDYKIGKYCEYSEDGSELKNVNIENQFNLNLNKVFSIIDKYLNNPIDNSQEKKYIQMNRYNQDFAFPGEKVNRYLDTNYGKVWILKRINDIFLIDDSNSSVIAKDNFIEFSKLEYEKKYGNINFRDLEQELGKKVLIINNSDDFGIN